MAQKNEQAASANLSTAASPVSIVTSTTYFSSPGKDNTEETLRLAKKRADELGIRSILVATTRGDTAVRAVELFQGYNLTVVTHPTGHKGPNTQELEPDKRAFVESRGGRVLTATLAFGGVGRSVRRRLNTYQTEEIIAYTLRLFSPGIKVACEMSLMAADAGIVRAGEEVVAVAGSSKGADSAAVITPANSFDFFQLRVNEIICKPRP
ncbi:MAG: hypothetical protein HYX87_00845 [Chloroflexi bacterium]|nr:hypothetical protein [Chloroflexota bacterium]